MPYFVKKWPIKINETQKNYMSVNKKKKGLKISSNSFFLSQKSPFRLCGSIRLKFVFLLHELHIKYTATKTKTQLGNTERTPGNTKNLIFI